MSVRRDLFTKSLAGHQFHTAAAVMALVLAPLGIALGEVALAILCVASAIRARELWPIWVDSFRSPIAIAFLLFVSWMLLSLLWSADPRNGADQIQCMRALLWAPLLYPLLVQARNRTTLLLALLAGTSVLAASQIAEWCHFLLVMVPQSEEFQRVFSERRFGGLHGEMGKAGLWSGAGVCIGMCMCLSRRLSPRTRIAVACATAVCITGVCVSGTVRTIGGIAVGACVSAICIATATAGGRPIRAAIAVLTIASLLCMWWALDRRVEMDGASSIVTMRSVAARVFWWSACWHGFEQHPLFGWGWGSTPAIIADYPHGPAFAAANPAVVDLVPSLLSPSQPHSLYIMVLAELGLIGIASLGAILCLIARATVRSARLDAAHAGAAAATILWIVSAAGDTVFNSSVLAAGGIVMALMWPHTRAEVD